MKKINKDIHNISVNSEGIIGIFIMSVIITILLFLILLRIPTFEDNQVLIEDNKPLINGTITALSSDIIVVDNIIYDRVCDDDLKFLSLYDEVILKESGAWSCDEYRVIKVKI